MLKWIHETRVMLRALRLSRRLPPQLWHLAFAIVKDARRETVQAPQAPAKR
jgi:hypothetical protein